MTAAVRFRSTASSGNSAGCTGAGSTASVDLATAMVSSTAPDGGLWLPERIEPLSASFLERLGGLPFPEVALPVLQALFGDALEVKELRDIVDDAFDFPIPLVEVEPGVFALELFHGPTLAFKDIGARLMARLLARLLPQIESTGTGAAPGCEYTVLVATSGDTGSAVAQAFHRLPGFRVVVLFPAGRVTELQRRQFSTLGDNVAAVEVAGSFDDCQALAKRAFADSALRSRQRLVSANSINVGRLLPQACSYFQITNTLPAELRSRPLVVATPSGNFGHLTAGVIARRLGFVALRLVAATNRNDSVPEYLRTGEFRPRPSVTTPSNAMDVGDPSNFARLLALYGGDREAMRAEIEGLSFSDSDTLAAIRRLFTERGYLLDPHAAVGYLGARAVLRTAPAGSIAVFLATAHPAKFGEIVAAAIGEPVALPEPLHRVRDLAERVISIPADYRRLIAILER